MARENISDFWLRGPGCELQAGDKVAFSQGELRIREKVTEGEGHRATPLRSVMCCQWACVICQREASVPGPAVWLWARHTTLSGLQF